MSSDLTTWRELDDFLLPHTEDREEFLKQNGRFVHYTSAEAAIKIINTKEIWMRNARCMVDYMEVLHGCKLLQTFLSNAGHKQRFDAAFADGAGREAIDAFDRSIEDKPSNIQFTTYITSVSEHDDKEDNNGRLSMWRGFGRLSPRAAIVLKLPPPGFGPNLLLRPVDYFGYKEVEQQLSTIISDAQGLIVSQLLRSIGTKSVTDYVFHMLVTIAVSLKHEGFREEREWRVIYMPELSPSSGVFKATKIIEGVPQIVYKIPLKDIPQLIERVIIGPSAFPDPIYEAFVVALEEAGISDAEKRVVRSGIPLRP